MFWNKVRNINPLVIDIGSREIRLLTYQVSPDTQGIITKGLGVGSLPEDPSQAQPNRDITDILYAIESAYIEAHQDNSEEHNACIIGIPGIIGESSLMEHREFRKYPNRSISDQEWHTLLKNIRCRVNLEHYQSKTLSHIPMKLAQSSLQSIYVDNIPCTVPLGMQGSMIQSDIFNVYVSAEYLTLFDQISTHLGIPLSGVFHTSYGIAKLIIDHHTNSELGMIIIEVGESHTDVTVVVNRMIRITQSFGIGGSSFTRRIAESFNLSWEDAEEAKIEYSKVRLPSGISHKIARILAPDIDTWVQGVRIILSETMNIVSLPEHIVLCGGSSPLIGLKEALEMKNWVSDLPFSTAPRISIFHPRNLNHIEDITGRIDDPGSIALLGLTHIASTMNASYTLGFDTKS